MTTKETIKMPAPTRKQMAQLKKSVREATKGSYEKQLEFLKKYPIELKKAIELTKKY